MKIALSILTLCKGGAQRVLADLANGLADRGHDVTVLLPHCGALEFSLRCKVTRTASVIPQASDFPVADVLVSNWYTTVPPVAEASRQGKGTHVRICLCYEPILVPGSDVSFPSYHLTQNVIVISNWQRQLVDLNHGLKATVVPCGIDPVFRKLPSESKPRKRLRLCAIVRKPEGGFAWHRDQDYLLEQLRDVKRLRPNTEIVLLCPAAEFNDSPTLQGLVSKGWWKLRRPIVDGIVCPPDDEDLCRQYNAADVFVVSGTYDAFPLPALEAMCCGCAVVTTYSGGNMEYCRHEDNCLVSYRHENRLGANVLRLIDDNVLRRAVAAAAEKERLRWTWQRSLDHFEDAFRKYAASAVETRARERGARGVA